MPRAGPGLPSSRCHCLEHCHHPCHRGTRLGPSPGSCHCSPLLPLRRARSGWVQAGAGCFSWVQAVDGQAGGSGGQPDPALPVLDICSPQHDAGNSGSCWEMGRAGTEISCCPSRDQRQITELSGWKSSPRTSSPTANPALPYPSRNHVPKCHIHTFLEHFQRCPAHSHSTNPCLSPSVAIPLAT